MKCLQNRCQCGEGYEPVSVLSLRAFWGKDQLPFWVPNEGPTENSAKVYCLPSTVGSYFGNQTVGSNCTVDILGSRAPRICEYGLTCLFCAGDVTEGTCVEFPLKRSFDTSTTESYFSSKSSKIPNLLFLFIIPAAIFEINSKYRFI